MRIHLSRSSIGHIGLHFASQRGGGGGGFKDTHPDDLLAPVLRALIEKTNLNPSEVGDIVVGTVLAPGSQRASECRMAAFYAGFPETVPIRTMNRQCSSGLQAVADVAAAIKAGFYDIGIGAGLESMTANPMAWEGSVNPRVLVRSSYIYIRSRQWHKTKIAYSQRVLLP
ncbi:hypothetical protein ACSBR2_012921 [Camellia fascicularis]